MVKLLHGLGYEVASLGGYIDPSHPHDSKRPALPDVPCHEVVKTAVDEQDTPDNLGAAQANIPDAILEWLGATGVIIFHHYLERLFGQWEHLREWRAAGGRVIWRTVGQSTTDNEVRAVPFREEGLEIVRYSPKEHGIPGFAGEDALIRFYKEPDEWCDWAGTGEFVANITQSLLRRHPWTNAEFYLQATEGLLAYPAGPESEQLPGGLGVLSYEYMQQYLRDARCYLYTGTQPASYTLGLLEALMTGVPTVSIGPECMTIFPYGPDLFEGADLCKPFSTSDPHTARGWLAAMLQKPEVAAQVSQHTRHRAMLEFGVEPVGKAWKAYLG